jgi:ArsR family transcriptional regulator
MMDEENYRMYELQAEILRTLANPKRLQIIQLLGEGEKTVSELASALNISLQNTSQNLRPMKDRGVVISKREGQAIRYGLANPVLSKCCGLVREAIIEEANKRTEYVQSRV